MKNGRLFYIAPMVWILSVALLIVSGITWFFQPIISVAELCVAAGIVLTAAWKLMREQKDIDRYMRRVFRHLNETDQHSLSVSPLPVAVVTDGGQILWHNDKFKLIVLDNVSVVGEDACLILPGVAFNTLTEKNSVSVDLLGHRYEVMISRLSSREGNLFVLYYLDVTDMRNAADEYAATRPVVMLIYIDNLEDLMQTLRDSERAKIEGLVETALEDWLEQKNGILQKFENDRFLAMLEKRYLPDIIEKRFEILDRVRALPIENNLQVTLSIGVGEGNDFRHCEQLARQAIEMALGRGGDQAALRTKNGFEFYGGLSKGVEKRTKVRTRVIASALQDLILSSDNVLLMGHRFSDLDCVGSGIAMVAVARALGKPAYLVVSRRTTLAKELIDRYDAAGFGDWFVDPADSLLMVQPKTLLIITDTQTPSMLEHASLYESVSTVAVIDHHRKMIDHIDKAVIFYHETYASSACEMVAELVQYMDIPGISRMEAEALLAGIMLDTRSFVVKAGVRTFEAAAYLRKQGADTVAVKKMFAGSMEVYREKSEIVAGVQIYGQTAIACAKTGSGADLRIACSQAADELLSIKGVDAAFTLFQTENTVNISARSFGAFNVQLVTEALGGGGHLTMAGAQLKKVSMEQAVEQLKKAIDEYLTQNSRGISTAKNTDFAK